jgi:hypothetical protein
MERYKNLGGDSNVNAYELGDGSITVRFNDGSHYQYTNQSAGAAAIASMQQLAVQGRGLNSFIMRYARKAYARKW